ncbi:hypothetical protein FACS1894170_10680 [Planctomycetales bacterium]|nr:hypothetical protein FACS1894170_10680 [Planctomycetales bacterium]
MNKLAKKGLFLIMVLSGFYFSDCHVENSLFAKNQLDETIEYFVLCYDQSVSRLMSDGSLYEYRALGDEDAPRIQIVFEGNKQYETVIDKKQGYDSYLCCGNDNYLLVFFSGKVAERVFSFYEIPDDTTQTSLLRPWTGFLGVAPIYYNGMIHANVVELLKKSKEYSIAKGEDDGSRVITCRGNAGLISFSVSLDIDHGFITKRLSFKNRIPDIGKVTEYSLVTKDFRELRGIFVPQMIEVTQAVNGGSLDTPILGQFITVDPKPRHLRYELVNTPEIISGESVFEQMRKKITDGVPVTLQDAPHIDHVWVDGKIEPKTDEVMLAIAQGDHKFIPGTDEPRFWFIALGVILIVVGFTLKGRELYKKWHSGDDKKGDKKP